MLLFLVQPLAHFLARPEERRQLFDHRRRSPGAGIAPDSRRALFSREGAKAAQFDALAPNEPRSDLFKNGIDNVFDITLIEMGITRRNPLRQFRFNQWKTPSRDIKPAFPAPSCLVAAFRAILNHGRWFSARF
jgi:hypothetical protein